MDDPLGVPLPRGVAELQRDMERAGQGHRPVGGRQRALERHAVEVFHDDVHGPVRQLTDEQHVDDVWVREAGSDLRFPVEPSHERCIGRQLAVENLHRDVAVDAPLKGAVDPPHGADADELSNLDVPEDLASYVRIRSRRRRNDARGRGQGRAVERTKERVGRKASGARRACLRRPAGPARLLGIHGTHRSSLAPPRTPR